jgi:large subunit ribosomal protein L22
MAAVEEDKVEFRAQARWVRTAPRKAQLVVEEIRGRTVPEAQVILAFMTRAAAKDVASVLRSAVANAESHPLSFYSGDDLYVAAAEVGTGPTLKRWRARARGRVGRIKKRTCHITIRLEPVEGAVAAASPRSGRAAAAAGGRQAAEEPRAEGPHVAAEPEPEAAVVEEPQVEVEPDAVEELPSEEPAAEAEAEAVEEPAEEAPAEEQPKPKPRASRPRKKKTDEPAPESPAGEES